MTINTVAVLGSGPAGLVAAHAAYLSGSFVTIFSRGVKSDLHGAQYLHAEIPELGIGIRSCEIDYQLIGTVEQYREKVYGKDSEQPVSVESLLGKHYAWDIRQTYNRLWHLYMSIPRGRCMNITVDIKPGTLHKSVSLARFDHVISTIPAPILCFKSGSAFRHDFMSQRIWAIGDAVSQDVEAHGYVEYRAPFRAAPDTVCCCGTDDYSWYRSSNIFGVASVEWPEFARPPIPGISAVDKPIGTDCDCYFENVYRTGRFGSWDKSKLVHHTFDGVMELLK